MRPKSELSPQSLWRETIGVYLLMTLITLVVGWLQGSVALLAGYGALISALAFMYLPTEVLTRRGEDPVHFGIGAGAVLHSARHALKLSLLVLPLYALGYHLWQGAQGRAPHVDARALSRWGEELRGRPMSPIRSGDVRLFAERDRLTLQWALLPQERALELTLKGWRGAQVRARSHGVQLERDPHDDQLTVTGSGRGSVTLSAPQMSLRYQLTLDGAPLEPDRLKLGGLLSSGESQGEQRRGWWWLLLTLATQLLLVAVPEELFYRGYIQGRLDELVGEDRTLWGAQVNLTSVTLTSALFALAHLATIPHPARLAVFFPSLLFGWMRRAYGNTLTPAIFHAICNLSAQLLFGCYAPL
jgi:membrane protease YdiL (CAAX protease family)